MLSMVYHIKRDFTPHVASLVSIDSKKGQSSSG